MKFGFFDDEAREYCITRPDTPYPWINYLGCENFFGLFSNTSGGYCFYKDARLLRVTRYRYNNIPIDAGGRYFYINDGGDVWSVGWQPVKAELDSYECRHGLGYSKITSSRGGIKASQTAMVPMGSNCELHKITLTNESDEAKSVKLFSFVEFCLWNAYDDMTNFQRNYSIGEVEVVGSTIYHKTEYRERRNHYAIFSVNADVEGFDTDKETFMGLYNGFDKPNAVFEGKCRNSMASGWQPIGAHCVAVDLAPGETKEYVFVLGYCENDKDDKWEALHVINKKPANEMIAKYDTAEKFDKALAELKEYWIDLLSGYQVKSEDEKMDRMVNIWNQYQCMVTFNMSRSASYFESGIGRGMGFRDSCQDLTGFVHLIPENARERIIDIASVQLEDGSAYHQYQPLTKKGNSDAGSGFNDDPMWLVFGVAAYVKESGDIDILDHMTPFNSDPSTAKPLIDHLKASFDHVINHLGPHGLPLIGRADWNDCLNLNCFSETPGESFQTTACFESGKAESVFIAGQFVAIGKDYVEMCKLKGLDEEAARAQKEIDKMYDTVLKYGWDGEWFLRAYDAFEQKVGSKECEEGQIFIEPQGFCVLAGIGVKEGLAEKALDSVKERLDTKYGIVLQQPPYQTYYTKLGEISSYPPGYKENAGIFCHNNPWISIAETVIGRGNRAFEVYSKICPAYLEDISDIHRTEPYVYSQMIAGKDAQNHGEAKNSWLTGTASWTFLNISEYILGIRADYAGLMVDPCIPETMKGFTVTRKFRGDTYVIEVDNTAGSQKGIRSLVVDGQAVEGNIIPLAGDGKVHYVKATM